MRIVSVQDHEATLGGGTDGRVKLNVADNFVQMCCQDIDVGDHLVNERPRAGGHLSRSVQEGLV